MENHHCLWENPLLMAIFNSYVKLPEGIFLTKYLGMDQHLRIGDHGFGEYEPSNYRAYGEGFLF